jgi:hypothetical protein
MTERDDLVAALIDIQEEFEWTSRAEYFESVDTWERERSGSSFHRMIGRPSGPDLLVKLVANWTPADAQRMFEAMVDLADTIDAAEIEQGQAVRPLGWADTPPMVVMPYVEGTDLVSLLRQPDHETWVENVPAWIKRAGMMLAAFHAPHLTETDTDIATAGNEVRELAARFRIDDAAIEGIFNRIDWRHRCSRSFGDFGPGNLLGAPNGDLYLLDPPDQAATALIHRDLANFIFEMRRQLAGRGFTRSRPIPGQFEALRSAFIEGYSVWHEEPLAAGDEALIALFEMRRAAGMARKRFPRRPGDAAWFARSALARRREVGWAVRQS